MLPKPSPPIKPPSWYQLESPQPQEPRYLHTATLFKHYLILICGATSESQVDFKYPKDPVLAFNLSTFQWETQIQLIKGEISPRHSHTACFFPPNRIIIYGGSIDNHTMHELLILTIKTSPQFVMTSRIIKQDVIMKRKYRTAEIYHNSMFIFGGIEQEDGPPLNELWELDLVHFVWIQRKVTGQIPCRKFPLQDFLIIIGPRLKHSSAVYNKRMYVFGGRDNVQPEKRFNDLWTLDFENLQWEEVVCRGDIPRPRNACSLVENHGILYLFGGIIHEQEESNELFAMDLTRGTSWNLVKARNKYPKPRGGHAAVFYKNNLFICQGANYNTEFSDIFMINPNVVRNKFENYRAQISQSLLNKQHSDVTFMVQNQPFPAHKIILTSRCQYFQKMFTSGMKESLDDVIEIPDCKPQAFKALLEYIYCNQVKLAEDFVVDLFKLVNQWRYVGLEGYCEDYLGNHLTLQNISEVSKVAETLDVKRLRPIVMEFVTRNLKELKENGELQKLSELMLKDILIKLYENKDSKKNF